jgi:hypothetical protein
VNRVDELLAGLGDYFTPDQKRAIDALSIRLVAEAVKSLPERLRAVIADYKPQTEYEHGVKGGVTLCAGLLEVLARGQPSPSLSDVVRLLACDISAPQPG